MGAYQQALNSKVFTADGSYGSSAGTFLVGLTVSHKSTIRAIAHIRSGSVAGGKVLHYDAIAAPGSRVTVPVFICDTSRPINGKAVVEVSGASTVATLFIRGPGA